MVSGMEATYDEVSIILDKKVISPRTTSYSLPPRIYKISDLVSMLKSSSPGEVAGKITIHDIGLRSNITTDKLRTFMEKKLFLCNFRFYAIPFEAVS